MTETEVMMEKLEKGHKTIIKSTSVTYNQNLTDKIFTKRHLEECNYKSVGKNKKQ